MGTMVAFVAPIGLGVWRRGVQLEAGRGAHTRCACHIANADESQQSN
jgi:hypothetical protein